MAFDIEPQPGPQHAALESPADILIYGGAAGGGKSWSLVFDALRFVDIAGFTAIYFRRTYPQLIAPDGIWDLSMNLWGHAGGISRVGCHDWRFPSGAHIVMGHLQRESDVLSHQGAQYCGIYFDELTHFTAKQFWYMLSRNRSTCGVRPYVRANCNPDPDSFVAELIAWWIGDDGLPIAERSGVLRWFVRDHDEMVWADEPESLRARHPGKEPLSLTFIGAKLEDNPALTEADPGYAARVEAMHWVEQQRLRFGNWLVRPAAGLYFQEGWFPVFDEPPGAILSCVRGWDKAATRPHHDNPDPDWTRGVKIAKLGDGSPVNYLVMHVASLRDGPGEVDRLIRNTASQDGRSVTQAMWQDPGQAGVVDIRHARKNLDGYTLISERASQNKIAYAGPMSSAAKSNLIGILRGSWNAAYLGELAAFPEGGHDDQVDAGSLAYMKLSGSRKTRAAPSGSEGRSRWGNRR